MAVTLHPACHRPIDRYNDNEEGTRRPHTAAQPCRILSVCAIPAPFGPADYSLVATAGVDGTVKLWLLGPETDELAMVGQIDPLCYHQENGISLYGCPPGAFGMTTADSGKGISHYCTLVRAVPSTGLLALALSSGLVQLWSLESSSLSKRYLVGKGESALPHHDMVTFLDFSSDASLLACGLYTGSIYLWGSHEVRVVSSDANSGVMKLHRRYLEKEGMGSYTLLMVLTSPESGGVLRGIRMHVYNNFVPDLLSRAHTKENFDNRSGERENTFPDSSVIIVGCFGSGAFSLSHLTLAYAPLGVSVQATSLHPPVFSGREQLLWDHGDKISFNFRMDRENDFYPTRSMSFSPTGEFLALPGGYLMSLAGVKPANESKSNAECCVIFQKGRVIPESDVSSSLNFHACLCLPGHAVVIGSAFAPLNCSSVSSQGSSRAWGSKRFELLIAVYTCQSVAIFSSNSTIPMFFVENIHTSSISDVCWSTGGEKLIIVSLDGSCSVLNRVDFSFDNQHTSQKSFPNRSDAFVLSDHDRSVDRSTLTF